MSVTDNKEKQPPNVSISNSFAPVVGDYAHMEQHFITRGTWTDGVAPDPLVNESGKITSPYRGLNAYGERTKRCSSAATCRHRNTRVDVPTPGEDRPNRRIRGVRGGQVLAPARWRAPPIARDRTSLHAGSGIVAMSGLHTRQPTAQGPGGASSGLRAPTPTRIAGTGRQPGGFRLDRPAGRPSASIWPTACRTERDRSG